MALLQRTRDDKAETLPDAVRERAEEAGEQLRRVATSATAEIGDHARRAADEAREGLEEHVVPLWRQVVAAVLRLARSVLGLAAVVPSVASTVLETVASVLHRLGDRSAALADAPTREDRRRSSRRRSMLWFGVGAVTGTAAGVAIGRATAPSVPDNVTHLDTSRAG